MTESARSVAVVTGGNGAIGRAICREAVKRGYDVLMTTSGAASAADGIVAELRESGAEARACRADLAAPDRAAEAVVSAAEGLGPVALLVNNAGVTIRGGLDVDLESWSESISVNTLAPVALAKGFASDLRSTSGAIVNLSSVAAFTGSLQSLPYGVTKAALLGVTKTLARMMAPDVRANAVLPGFVESPMSSDLPRGRRDVLEGETLLGRFAVPAEIATAVLDIAGWTFCTGQSIVVDGGRVLH